ncbi:hypothetical protein HDU76_003944 [Blyttiomyces sp. JEL0837]|nr:hypothetical protein HDU76_003944 [Blyttiomyces sp. JEL0837]
MSPSDRPPFAHDKTFTFTQPPHPEWQPGDNTQQPLPSHVSQDAETVFDVSKITPGEAYQFLISAVIPRPIALITTQNPKTNITNIAPFSYFNMVCHNPATLMISINLQNPTTKKDTLTNIEASSEFVVNSFNEHITESANHTSINSPYDISEAELSGIELVDSKVVKIPRIKHSHVSFECKHEYTHYIKDDQGNLATGVVFGRILSITVKDGVLLKDPRGGNVGTVDPAKYGIVSRLGGNTYGRVTEGFELPRPRWQG